MVLTFLIFCIGFLFTYSGILKFTELIEFHDVILSYNLTDKNTSYLLTLAIPTLETLCGIGLITGIFRRGSALIISILLVMFIGAISIGLIRNLQLYCGCFGSLEIFSVISINNIVLDIILLLPLALFLKTNYNFRKTLNDSKILLLYAGVLMIIINMPFSNAKLFAEQHIKQLKYISFEQFVSFMENDQLILFDARDYEDYEEYHIPSAVSLPVKNFDTYYRQYKNYDKDRNIVVYCDGSYCNGAEAVAVKLIKKFYKNVFVFKAGIEKWKEHELNTH